MAEFGTNNGESKLKREVKVDSGSKVPYNYVKPGVKLRSLKDARLMYTGQVTGKQYVWNKAGDVIEVDALDSEILLAKRAGQKSCCGNSRGGRNIFEIA